MSDNQKLIDSFSPIYQSFLPSLFQEEIPRERYATCSDCAMCPKPDQPTSPNVNYFSPSTKCCTFFPILPNYLIGELLSDSSPDRKEGRSRIQAMIKNKTGVYPHGIFPPADYFARYAHDQEKGFGKQEDLLCPYYIKEGGLCGVYNSWNAYCSTYFCKQVAGKDGKAFWDTVKEYFIYAENVLSKHALIALGFTPNIALEKDMEFEVNMMKYQLQKSLDKPFTKPDYSKLWGDWEGKEEDLYKSCYDHVKSMPSKTFLEVGGALQDVYLGQIKEALHTMRDPDIPSHLKKHPDLIVEWSDPEHATLILVASIHVPKLIVDIINLFTGKPSISDVKSLCLSELNADLHDDVVKMLYQQKVLIPVEN